MEELNGITQRFSMLVLQSNLISNLQKETVEMLKKMLDGEFKSTWQYNEIFEAAALSYLSGSVPNLNEIVKQIRTSIEYEIARAKKDNKTETKQQ